jgi:hypothetical protein
MKKFDVYHIFLLDTWLFNIAVGDYNIFNEWIKKNNYNIEYFDRFDLVEEDYEQIMYDGELLNLYKIISNNPE